MKINAMIIDDSEHDRYLLKRRLMKCSFDTVISEATDGQNALDYFQDNRPMPEDGYPPDIVFLDINMPRVSGFEFLEKYASVRDAQSLSSTVIVMFTSSPRQDDKDRAMKWGFVHDYLVKGDFDTKDIEQIVSRYLAKDPV